MGIWRGMCVAVCRSSSAYESVGADAQQSGDSDVTEE